MAFRDSFAQCPRCGITLEDANAARGCRGCGGVFLEQPVLAEMLLHMLPPPPRVWGPLVLSESARGEPPIGCPDCGDAMKPTTIHEVELDHCGKHGVWFDQDELRITLYRVADPKNPPPFGEWVPSPYVDMAPPPPPKPAPPPPPPRPPSPSTRSLVFHVVQPGYPPREIALDRDIIKIGRMNTSHIQVVGDPNISRMHAVIEATRDGITIIDLGSTSGTFVNDAMVTKSKVEVGDTIRVGNAEIVLISAT